MNRACWTCRSRTIQCDQSQSPCAKCEKAGLQCFDKRPLRWVKGAAIRGKMRGRLYGDSNSDGLPISNTIQGRKQKRMLASGVECLPAFALQDPRISNLDRASRYYMDYCELLSSSTKTNIFVSANQAKITTASANCSFSTTVKAIRFGICFPTP